MQYDFIVVGSGLAGLSFALKAAKLGKVLVLSKSKLIQTNTWRAQGGVASVTSSTDSFEKHIEDTLIAGDGLCQKESVTHIIEQGPRLIQELIAMGVVFDSTNNKLDLGQEGGHSQRRILHIDDTTGQALHTKLLDIAINDKNIDLIEDSIASELIVESNTCAGIHVFNNQNHYEYHAPHTILATGGAGKVFFYTSNWSGATGDGLSLAYEAGAQLSNLEFVQFHPTCLYHPAARNFLITEALRGEGAKLINKKGEAFMAQYHKLADLAPRDIVARAIDQEMKTSGSECVWLDVASLKNEKLKIRFPKIYQKCLELGIDFLKSPIPVVPAAHYLCGGITVNQNSETSIKGLFALGECCDSGLHGANRLASNSLLECLATAQNAITYIRAHPKTNTNEKYTKITPLGAESIKEESKFQITTLWEELRRMMWLRMGIVRSNGLMLGAFQKINFFTQEIERLLIQDPSVKSHKPFIELKNLCLVSKLMIESAMNRKESRGCHFNTDYPHKNEHAQSSHCQLGHKIEYTKLKRQS